MKKNLTLKSCADCKNFWYEGGGTIEQPYPEFACLKEHWDGVNNYESLNEKTDCKDFEKAH